MSTNKNPLNNTIVNISIMILLVILILIIFFHYSYGKKELIGYPLYLSLCVF